MVTSISQSPAETFLLGKQWGQSVQPGLVIALCGDLGAGKTLLVKGLAEGLGITRPILSPTFSLVNVYADGRVPLFHLDLYRLDHPEQIVSAGLEEYFHPNGVSVIEWAERWFRTMPGKLPPEELTVIHGCGERTIRWVDIQITTLSERRISYEDISA